MDTTELLWLDGYLRQRLGGPLRAAYPRGVSLAQIQDDRAALERAQLTKYLLRLGCQQLEYYLNGDNVIGVPGTY
jgi:hypothetical protein